MLTRVSRFIDFPPPAVLRFECRFSTAWNVRASGRWVMSSNKLRRLLIAGFCLVIISRVPASASPEDSHTDKAYKLAAEKKFDEAVVEFREAIKENPKDIKARTGFASVLLSQNRS